MHIFIMRLYIITSTKDSAKENKIKKKLKIQKP